MDHSQHPMPMPNSSWRDYVPLLVVITLILVSALIVSSDLESLITNFMAGFFLVFAGFKLMDLRGFAHGYAEYDLLASRWFAYGYIYPFIELGFGLIMLAGLHTVGALWAEVVVMIFSGLGVVNKMAKREPVHCVCLGNVLKVPLTKVTLIEDFGMAILALVLIFL